MKKDLSELVFILDRSGSMHGLEDDTIGGFNSFVEKQKEVDGQCLVSTVLFNQRSEVIHDRVSLDKIGEMTRKDYVASGTTALIDALGDAIHHIGNVHKYIREEDVPEHTVFVIITDGLENASTRYSSENVKKMISEKKEKGWEFLFLAANIDAVETARSYGIEEDRSVNFRNDKEGIALNFATVAEACMDVRCDRKIDRKWKKKIEEDFEKRS